MNIDLPTDAEVAAVVRSGLSSLGEPPPLIVEELVRKYFEQWAMRGTKARADEWLVERLAEMTGEPR